MLELSEVETELNNSKTAAELFADYERETAKLKFKFSKEQQKLSALKAELDNPRNGFNDLRIKINDFTVNSKFNLILLMEQRAKDIADDPLSYTQTAMQRNEFATNPAAYRDIDQKFSGAFGANAILLIACGFLNQDPNSQNEIRIDSLSDEFLLKLAKGLDIDTTDLISSQGMQAKIKWMYGGLHG